MDKDQQHNINLKVENKDVAQFTGMARVQEFVRTVMSVLGMIVSVLIVGGIIAVVGFFGWAMYTDSQNAQQAKPQQQQSKSQPAKSKQATAPQEQVATAPTPQKPVIDLAPWRQLKKDQSPNDVRALLGEPNHVQGGNFSTWSYPNNGSVTFYKDVVYLWREPSN